MPKEVKDIYKECIQYDSIEAGIKAHAETYSFNIEETFRCILATSVVS